MLAEFSEEDALMESSMVNLVKDDLSNLDNVLKYYDKHLSKYDSDLEIDGKTYGKALSQQAGLLAWYSELNDELEILEKELEARLRIAKDSAMKRLERISPEKQTEFKIKFNIESDPTCIALGKAVREVEERKKKSATIVMAFNQRGYALNNMIMCRRGEFLDEKIYVNE